MTTGSLDRSSQDSKWFDRCVLVTVGLIAAVLRFYQLERPGIWFDESSSCRWIEYPIVELCQRTMHDCHPPFYWILLKCWAGICGESVGVLRSLSSLFGIATVLATYGLVRDLPLLDSDGKPREQTNSIAPLLASLLVATSPFHTEWSQEMRMYSLGTFEAISGTWLLVRALSSTRWNAMLWGGYALVGILSLYTLYFSLFTLVGHAIFVVGTGVLTGRWAKGYFVAALCIAAGWLPWLPSLWAMFGTVQTSFPQGQLTWGEFRDLYWLMFVPQATSFNDGFAKTAIIEVSIGVAAFSLFSGSPSRILVALCAVTPFYAILNLSLMSQNLMARHRLILGQIFLLVAIAIMVAGIHRVRLRRSVVALIVLASCWTSKCYLDSRDARASLPGMRAAVQMIDQTRTDDALVVFVNPMLYLNGLVYFPNRVGIFAKGQRRDYPYYQGSSLTRDTDYLKLESISPSTSEVWVVDADKWLGGSWHISMTREWQIEDEKHFAEFYADIVVRRYRRKSTDETL